MIIEIECLGDAKYIAGWNEWISFLLFVKEAGVIPEIRL